MNTCASAFLLVRPTTFGFDEQTAQTNAFQYHVALGRSAVTAQAEAEFDAYVQLLQAHDIQAVVFEDENFPPKPNAVFPNNWISTWPDGRVFLYPMATESRRIERNPAVLDLLRGQYAISDIIDLSAAEQQGRFLESTGVIVFDHPHRTLYACVSVRCNESLLRDHAKQLGYKAIVFTADDQQGTPIYHTNIMLSIQRTTAVICLEAIRDNAGRQRIRHALEASGHRVIDITFEQMNAYCANILEVKNRRGQSFLVMSDSAFEAFTPDQRRILGADKQILHSDLGIIQRIGGGSARCMLAELYLPKLPMGQQRVLPIRDTLVQSA